MSTSFKNVTGNRIASLAASQKLLFHIDDLALLFGVQNENTLRVTLNRYVKSGILHRIQRGLYSILHPEKIDPVMIGSACLHRYCYISAETVLRSEGYILQSLNAFTFFSGVSRRFEILGHRYISRRLNERYLHNQTGIYESNGVLIASHIRAIADLLYIDPWYHFDSSVNWSKVRAMQEEIGYPLTRNRYVDSKCK